MKYFYLFFFISVSVYSQNKQSTIDSLFTVINKSKIDTVKINTYFILCQKYGTSDIEKADSLSKILFKLSKKNNYIKGLGYYYFDLGTRLKSKKNYKLALKNHYKANFYFNKLKNKSDYLESIYNIAFCYDEMNESQKGKDLVIKTLNTFEKSNYIKQLSYLNYYLGVYYSKEKRDLKKSIDYLIKSAYYAKKSNFIRGTINCYSRIILIYIDQKNWQKGHYYGTLCIKHLDLIAKKNENINQLYYATIYSYLGKCNYFLTKYSVSLSQSKKALELGKKIKDEKIIYFNLNLISINYYHLGNYALSLEYAQKLISRYPDSDIEVNNQLLGKCYYKLHNYPKAIHFLKIALKKYSNSIENENYFEEFSLYQDLAAVSLVLKDYKNAYLYANLYSDIKIEFLESENKNNKLELTERFHSSNLEMDNNILLQNKRTKQLESILREEKLLFISAISVLFLILICVLLFKNNSIKRKNLLLRSQKIKLEDSDLTINNSLMHKQLLLKEIHHRVKNNLQLIISLQNIQARRNINGTITDFLLKEQGRIRTMSLIHQSLYENDDLAKVDISEYINKLVEHIKDSETENKISIELSFNKLYFDLETALPLGLIINELIANSYKHAFPDGITGTITISIVKLFENNFRLEYSDNGIPFINITDDSRHFGLELIQLLVKQLKGTILPFNIEKKEFAMLFYTINTET